MYIPIEADIFERDLTRSNLALDDDVDPLSVCHCVWWVDEAFLMECRAYGMDEEE
jgi:hypothetical protein